MVDTVFKKAYEEVSKNLDEEQDLVIRYISMKLTKFARRLPKKRVRYTLPDFDSRLSSFISSHCNHNYPTPALTESFQDLSKSIKAFLEVHRSISEKLLSQDTVSEVLPPPYPEFVFPEPVSPALSLDIPEIKKEIEPSAGHFESTLIAYAKIN